MQCSQIRRRKLRNSMSRARQAWICLSVLLLFAPQVRGQNWVRIDVDIDNPTRAGQFGRKIDVLGDVMLVAYSGDDTVAPRAGAILLYDVTETGIQYRERIFGSRAESGDRFGWDWIVNGDNLLIRESRGTDVYHFQFDGHNLTEMGMLPMPEIPGHIYTRQRMAMDGEWAFVGVRAQTIEFPRNYYTSTVFVFKLTGGVWEFHSQINPPNFPEKHPSFGSSLDIMGANAMIYDATDPNATEKGAGPIMFELVDGKWEELEILMPADGVTKLGRPQFLPNGEIRAQSGNTIYWLERVGNSWEEVRQKPFLSEQDRARGAIWQKEFGNVLFRTREVSDVTVDWLYIVDVYGKSDGPTVWEYISSFQSPEPGDGGDGFGLEIALTDTFIVVAAPFLDIDLSSDGGGSFSQLGTLFVGIKDYFVPRSLTAPSKEAPPSTSGFTRAYPNPSTGMVTFDYDVASATTVKLSIYDVLGREVALILSAFRRPGSYTEVADLSRLSTGVYYYRLSIGRASEVRPISMIH